MADNMQQPGLLFIESNTTGSGMQLLEMLTQAAFPTTFLTRNRMLYPKLNNMSSSINVVELDTNNIDTVFDYINEYGPARYFGITTYSEYYVETCAQVARRFGWKYLNPAVAALCRDKAALRKSLAESGLPSPRFAAVHSVSALQELAKDWPMPAVIKPLGESGSIDVTLARTSASLVSVGEKILARTTTARGQPIEPGLLIESYLDGPEFSVETVSLSTDEVHVIGITAKGVGACPFFVETEYSFPAELPSIVSKAIEDAAIKALRCVGYDWGFAHVELRLHQGEPYIIEVNPRLAGGHIPDLIRLTTGFDLQEAALALARGLRPQGPAPAAAAGAARFLIAERAGRLTTLIGIDAAKSIPGIVDIAINKRIGDQVRPAESNLDRLGAVIATAGTPSLARALADRTASLIQIEVNAND